MLNKRLFFHFNKNIKKSFCSQALFQTNYQSFVSEEHNFEKKLNNLKWMLKEGQKELLYQDGNFLSLFDKLLYNPTFKELLKSDFEALNLIKDNFDNFSNGVGMLGILNLLNLYDCYNSKDRDLLIENIEKGSEMIFNYKEDEFIQNIYGNPTLFSVYNFLKYIKSEKTSKYEELIEEIYENYIQMLPPYQLTYLFYYFHTGNPHREKRDNIRNRIMNNIKNLDLNELIQLVHFGLDENEKKIWNNKFYDLINSEFLDPVSFAEKFLRSSGLLNKEIFDKLAIYFKNIFSILPDQQKLLGVQSMCFHYNKNLDSDFKKLFENVDLILDGYAPIVVLAYFSLVFSGFRHKDFDKLETIVMEKDFVRKLSPGDMNTLMKFLENPNIVANLKPTVNEHLLEEVKMFMKDNK